MIKPNQSNNFPKKSIIERSKPLLNAGKEILNGLKDSGKAGLEAMQESYSNGLDEGKGFFKNTIDADKAAVKAGLKEAKAQKDSFVVKHEKGLDETQDRGKGAATGGVVGGLVGGAVAGLPGAIIGGVYCGLVGGEAGFTTLKTAASEFGQSINKNLVSPVVDTAKNIKGGV